ncbi:aminomethyl-transferring glycine dehydrogenase subunit GcvPB [bacterium]
MKNKIIFDFNSLANEYLASITSDESDGILKGIAQKYLKASDDLDIPDVSEVEVARHYTLLSKKAYGVDDGIYPLGSCTMKYNPKINEKIAAQDAFNNIHPELDEKYCQGILKLLYDLEKYLCEVSGMDALSVQPSAGAHGEFTGILMIDAFHKSKNDLARKKVIVPSSSHGTNPASCNFLGMQVVEVACDKRGNVDVNRLKDALDDKVACLMLTNPSTFGLFEENIVEIAKLVHENGSLLYYDGANLNPILGKTRPGDMGFDVMHFNLHKTFAAPHGCGGPGAGPVGVKSLLAKFLPNPRIVFNNEENIYSFKNDDINSIGKVRSFYGNFLVCLKSFVYILSVGRDGLEKISDIAVLNANYLLAHLKSFFDYPFDDRTCMHEFVVSGKALAKNGVKTLDIAKRMIDYNIHPPTIYFPINIPEALMFEPTETESLESMDHLISVVKQIANEAAEAPGKLTSAPSNTAIGRLDEVKAVKELDIAYKK